MRLRDQLLAEIDAFCAGHGMSQSAFGRQVMSDASFVSRLREGRRFYDDTVDRVRDHIRRHPIPDLDQREAA